MVLRIIALTIVVCLSLGTFSLAGEKLLLLEDTSHLYSPGPSIAEQLYSPGPSIAEQRRSMLLALTLVSFGLGLSIEAGDAPGWVLAVGVLGFLWMQMQSTSSLE